MKQGRPLPEVLSELQGQDERGYIATMEASRWNETSRWKKTSRWKETNN